VAEPSPPYPFTALGIGGAATAAAPDITQNTAKEPANLGLVKDDVESYYGDYLDASGHHHASEHSDWAKQTAAQDAKAKTYLATKLADGVRHPAMVLDVDDTSELTYGLAADSDFGYDPKKSEEAIDNNGFPAIRPTLNLAKWATARGVKLYFITGRPEHQRPGTVKGLALQGFPKPAGLFLKPETDPAPYLPCGLKCTTIQYKSGTRAYLQSKGNTIVINVGDQYSDLEGGSAMRGFKLPNPMYYLP
jgi:predicted secreted acid phosphatase